MRQTPPFAQLLPDFLFKSGGSEVSAEPVVSVRLRPNSSDRYWFGGAPLNGNPCHIRTNGTSEGDCYWFGEVTTGVPLPCRAPTTSSINAREHSIHLPFSTPASVGHGASLYQELLWIFSATSYCQYTDSY